MKPWLQAARSLRRRPLFSLSVAGLLTLGIGANTALFSVVDTVLWKPLPYPDAGHLVTILEASPAKNQKESLIAPGRIEDWNRLNRTFSAISGTYSENVTDISGREPERLAGRRVAPRYFQVFGARPLVGRTFTSEEERAGGPLAAVISYGLWARRYGLDPQVTNRRLVLAGQGYSIIGVMPSNFAASSIDVWLPAQTPPFLLRQRNARYFSGVGRIRRGVTLQQASADLASVQSALGEQFPATDRGWSASIRDMKAARVGDSARPLLLLFGAVGMLLLITVTNVASLVLAQLHQRERELAIRASIGATRGQVVAVVMREIGLVAAAGALGGWAASWLSLRVIVQMFATIPRIHELAIDWRALAFAVGAGVAGLIAFGFLPAWRATGARYAGTFLRAGRGIAGKRQWVQRVLVASQIAVTMALVAGAGLLVRSFYNLTRVDLGFSPSHAFLFHVGAAWDEDRARIGRMQERLLGEFQRLPGVEAAGLTNFLPASGATLRYQATLEGTATTEEDKMPVGERTVSPGYLKALHAPLVAGTWCPELRLDPNAPPRAMVNRRFVDVYAKGANVVGRHIRVPDVGVMPWEIVGVIGNLKEDAVGAPVYPYLYSCAMGGWWPDPEYVIRTAADPRSVMASVRQLVSQIAPGRAIFGVRTLDDALAEDLDQPRANARMLGLFALAAMLLAAVGLYGLVTEMVSARRQEIGIRMAIGADPAQIIQSLVGNAGGLIAAGIVGGIALVLAAQPVLRSQLFGVSPVDAASLSTAALVLGVIALLAAFLPARRAARIDPVESLRAE
jgi:putative ABC transport system permease protein